MTTCHILKLPDELLEIAEYFVCNTLNRTASEQSILSSLSKTCRKFYEFFSETLIAHPVINDVARFSSLVTLLVDRPLIRLQVQFIDIHINCLEHGDKLASSDVARFCDLFESLPLPICDGNPDNPDLRHHENYHKMDMFRPCIESKYKVPQVLSLLYLTMLLLPDYKGLYFSNNLVQECQWHQYFYTDATSIAYDTDFLVYLLIDRFEKGFKAFEFHAPVDYRFDLTRYWRDPWHFNLLQKLEYIIIPDSETRIDLVPQSLKGLIIKDCDPSNMLCVEQVLQEVIALKSEHAQPYRELTYVELRCVTAEDILKVTKDVVDAASQMGIAIFCAEPP